MQARPLGAEVSSVWLMTGGFPEVKVISFGLHKHETRWQRESGKIVFVLFFSWSPKTRRHHALASVEVVPLHYSDYDYDNDYDYDYDFIFITIMTMMAMSCAYFLRSRQTLRGTVTTRELKTIACPLQTNTFDMRSISVCLFNFKPTWGPLNLPEFFSQIGPLLLFIPDTVCPFLTLFLLI